MKNLLIMVLGITVSASGQDFVSSQVRGFRAYGLTEASLPVSGLRTKPVTLEFDIVSSDLPALQLRFVHCDRDWNPTPTSFVNDEILNRSKSDFTAEESPNGVRGYTFHYKMRIPGYPHFDGFQYSGNYLYQLWDRENEEMLVQGKFFVTEDRIAPRMRISNRQEPSATSPYNQVHEIRVGFSVPPPDSTGARVFDAPYFSAVDVYKNREMDRRRRASTDDQDPHTFIEGFGTERLEFVIDDVQPGSEYRSLDLRNNDFYPQGRQLRPRGGADLSRFLGKTSPDNNGGSSIVRGTIYADYLDFQFELLWKTEEESPIYLVGDFNGWKSGPSSLMSLEGDRFVWKTALRRGKYDYQYVIGEDWVILEGNDWGTTNTYTAMLYYRDPRFGGFDRLVGAVSGTSRTAKPASD